MVNHYTKTNRTWTKRTWADLPTEPSDIDLGYEVVELGVTTQGGDVVFYDQDPESSGEAWIAAEESAVINHGANP